MDATGAPEYWPLAILRVTNTASRSAAQIVAAEIPRWSRRLERILVVGPGETSQVDIPPQLLPRAFRNDETQAAQLELTARSLDGALFHAESRAVLIHGGSEIYWGRKFANAQIVARWVTPHDPVILDLIGRARPFISRGRLAGYSRATGDSVQIARHVTAQAKAVYRAIQDFEVGYVNSIFVMGDYVGEAQRVRLPRETLYLKTANCMDMSVVFASAMENLGMQPLLVIVPGHSFAGVRLGHDAADVLYVDLTVLPNGSFESAVARAKDWLARTATDETLVVDIAAARVLGVYPAIPELS
jgi:hypothetical protein